MLPRPVLLLLWSWLSLFKIGADASLLRGLQKEDRVTKTLGNFRLVDENGSDVEAATNTDQCGLDVAIDGTIAIVGCPGTDGGVGSVQVYDFENGDWTLSTTIRPTMVNLLGLFGANVALRNSVIVVGSYTNSVPELGAGGAFVYEKVSGVWTQTASLSLDEPALGDQFGRDVAISDDGRTIAIGASLADVPEVPDSGIVAVYQKVGSSWIKQGTLAPKNPEAFSGFGSSLGIHGQTIVVGAFGRTVGEHTAQGEVLVFDEVTEGNFTQTAVLRANDGDPSDTFGNAVDIHQDRIVVGAVNDDNDATTDAGSVYVFDRQQATSMWKQVAKLTPSKASPLARFGQSVAVFGEKIAIGAVGAHDFQVNTGAVYVFERTNEKFHETSILGSNQNQLVGISVGFSSTDLIVGAPGGVRGSAFVEQTEAVGKCIPQVTSFSAIDIKNAKKSQIDFAINVQELGGLINIRAEVDDCGQADSFKCVKLGLGSDARLQRSEPYHLFATDGGIPDSGFGLLQACLFDDEDCTVGRKGCLDIDTVVLDCIPSIESFILYDATTDQPLGTISNGQPICLPPGGMINIKAIADCVDFVEFAFRGANGRSDDRVESTAPYFLYGDRGNDVLPQYDMRPMPPGLYALRARFRPANSLLGQGTVLTQRFTLVDCSSAEPSLQPSLVPSASPTLTTSHLVNDTEKVFGTPTAPPSPPAEEQPPVLNTTAPSSSATGSPTTMTPTLSPTVMATTGPPTTSPTTLAPSTVAPSMSPTKTATTTGTPSEISVTSSPTFATTTSPPVTGSPVSQAPITISPSIAPSLTRVTKAPMTTSPTLLPSTTTGIPTTLAPAIAAPSIHQTIPVTRTLSPTLSQATDAPTTLSPVLSQAETSSPSIESLPPSESPVEVLPSIGGVSVSPTTISPSLSPKTAISTMGPNAKVTLSPSLSQMTSAPTKIDATSLTSTEPHTSLPTMVASTSAPVATLAPSLTQEVDNNSTTSSPASAQSLTPIPSTSLEATISPTLSPVVGPPSIGGGPAFFLMNNDG